MSDIAEWLMSNRERLDDIACTTTVVPRVVHLIAVLILAGLSDVQIRNELAAVGSRSETRVPAEDVDRVLALIRCLDLPRNRTTADGRESAP